MVKPAKLEFREADVSRLKGFIASTHQSSIRRKQEIAAKSKGLILESVPNPETGEL